MPEGLKVATLLKAIKQPVARKSLSYLRRNRSDLLRLLEVKRKGEVEHRFWTQGGGYDRNVVEPLTAAKMVNYMHMNPVRRGLVSSPYDWEWSSARWYASMDGVQLQMDGGPPGYEGL